MAGRAVARKPGAKTKKPAAKTGGAKKKPRASGGRLTASEIAVLFDRFAAANPDPRGELAFINPYTLLVAVVLSAQATDASVNKATEPLFKLVDHPAAMLKLGETRLKDYIRTIGLYNTKAKNIIRLSQILLEQFGTELPEDRSFGRRGQEVLQLVQALE